MGKRTEIFITWKVYYILDALFTANKMMNEITYDSAGFNVS